MVCPLGWHGGSGRLPEQKQFVHGSVPLLCHHCGPEGIGPGAWAVGRARGRGGLRQSGECGTGGGTMLVVCSSPNVTPVALRRQRPALPLFPSCFSVGNVVFWRPLLSIQEQASPTRPAPLPSLCFLPFPAGCPCSWRLLKAPPQLQGKPGFSGVSEAPVCPLPLRELGGQGPGGRGAGRSTLAGAL